MSSKADCVHEWEVCEKISCEGDYDLWTAVCAACGEANEEPIARRCDCVKCPKCESANVEYHRPIFAPQYSYYVCRSCGEEFTVELGLRRW